MNTAGEETAMTRKPERTGLGRGLAALLGDLEPESVTVVSLPAVKTLFLMPSM